MSNDPAGPSVAGTVTPEMRTGVTQGYVTVAFGSRKFFEMAVNLALSVRLNDPGRPVCLIHKASQEVPADVAGVFDDLAAFPADDEDAYDGTALKLIIDRATPYDETFYIDSDCVILKKDMQRHWATFANSDFMVCGEKRTEGNVYSLNVPAMMDAAGIDYFVEMNSGVIFFRKSQLGNRVFETARDLYRNQSRVFTEVRSGRGDGINDQAFFGAAMAACGIEPITYPASNGALMATTYRARNIEFDLDKPLSFLEKPTGFRILNRFWAKGWVRHDTTIGHFVNGMPKGIYQRISDQLRAKFDWNSFDFSRS
ncbi:MAG: hypothetical protein KDF64_15505 [Geminicoccaceae bacterium]|nr:hypothetical protein [Geminicoccaceae bacterium]